MNSRGNISGWRPRTTQSSFSKFSGKSSVLARESSIFSEDIILTIPFLASLNNGIRSFNGPEDAQDYLWLTQDLWMEKDIWNWANDNPDVKDAVLKVCSRPECNTREVRVAEYKQCAGCHLVSYRSHSTIIGASV